MSICLPVCMRSCKRKMPKQSVFEIGFMLISSKKKKIHTWGLREVVHILEKQS